MISDNEKKLSIIIESAIDGIISMSTSGLILSANSSVAKMFQYTKEELIGQNVRIIMPEPDKSSHDAYIKHYMKTKTVKVLGKAREVKAMKKDGSVFFCRLSVSEVELEDETVFTGVIHDLTDYVEARDRINKLNRELEDRVVRRTFELENALNKLLETNKILQEEIREREKVELKLTVREEQLRESLTKEKELGELKSRFVSMASHEFKTPLATILSSSALISKYTTGDQQDKRNKHTTRIKKSVEHLTAVLNDILSLGRLDEKKVILRPEEFCISQLASDVIDEFSSRLKEGQNIHLGIKGEIHTLFMDKGIMKAIFMNLVSNAVKYSSMDVNIEIAFYKNFFNITISDKGVGIPLEDQRHLFTRFFRASNVANIKGTGLGLNIVKTYLEIYKGTISFESSSGKGSKFIICLPKPALNRLEHE